MAFRFRLERVLRLREQLRREAQRELEAVSCRAARLWAAARARETEAERVLAAEAEAIASGELTGADLRVYRDYEASQHAQRVALVERAMAAEREAAIRRAALLERRREERQLERLRERARGRAEEAARRAEADFLDDLACRR